MTVEISEEQYQRLHDDIKQEVIGEVKEEIADELQSSNEVEIRSDGDNAGLGDIWIAGNPIGTLLDKALQNSSDAKKTAEQARATRSAEDNPKGEPDENTLPIQQTTKIWKVGGTIRAKKTEHAAALWSDFFDRAKKGREHYYLPTDRVEQILREHFRDDDNHLAVGNNITRTTIHRAMDAFEELAGNLVSSDIIRNGRRALMINQQEFEDFLEAIGAVTDDVTGDSASSVTRSG